MIPNYYFNDSVWRKDNAFVGTEAELEFRFNNGVTVGIIFDFCHYHANYIQACHDLEVNYKVIAIHTNNWIEQIESSGCDLFFVWPSVYTTAWKTLFDERLYHLTTRMGKSIYPTFSELFMYESKKRVRDILISDGIPHPKTHVFYTLDDAMTYIRNCTYPLVFKTDLGAASHGVEIVKSKPHAIKLIKKCFTSGYLVDRADQRDRRWGYIIFQEYHPIKNEWRIVRVGEVYFSRLKHKKGEYFSGSGIVSWAKPPVKLLDMVKEITDRNGYSSMAVDIFETDDGIFLVNEMQTMFGGIKKMNTSRNVEDMGCYTWDVVAKKWNFTSGYFYDNACANLRIRWALSQSSISTSNQLESYK